MAIYEMGRNGGLVPVDVPANSIKNNLPPGTVLHWGGNMGFPAEDFAVINRLPDNGFGVMYDTIGMRGYSRHRVESYSIKSESDPSVWHGQHFFLTGETVAGDELLDLIGKANATETAKQEAASARAAAHGKEVARLRAERTDLVQLSESNRNSLTTAAKNIRRELAKAFPGVKFSVGSKRYSGGDSINIDWMDGPTSKSVDAIADKYQGCDFDGMTDSTEYRHNAWIEVFGEAKYVHCSRHLSANALRKVREELGYTEAEAPIKESTYDGSAWIDGGDYDKGQTVSREAHERAF